MSVKVSKLSVKQWRDMTVGEFDCRYKLADLEKGRALTSETFVYLGSTWYFSVKGSKEWTPGVWKFDAMLRCLPKGEGIRDSCEVAMGDVRLRLVVSDVPRGFWHYYYTVIVAKRDLCERYAEKGTVRFYLIITAVNPARFVAENTNLKFGKEATNKEKKRPVEERETGGRLEGDTGRAEGPPPQSETGGMKGDTRKAERPTTESETGGLEGNTGKAERPPAESKTGLRPPRGDGADTLLFRSIFGEISWLFPYCAFMCHMLGPSCDFMRHMHGMAYEFMAFVGMVSVHERMSDVLQQVDSLTYLFVLAAISCCGFIPPYFRFYLGHTVEGDFLFCLFILGWTFCLTVWKSMTTPDKGIQGTPDGRQ